jgi:RNA polymerase sigma-70 factor (TIGR02960 family)
MTQSDVDTEFGGRTEPHRRELHVHCYRMLASYDEAEDAVQETFLRAWRARGSFDGSQLWRAWLYRIATNVCLDLLRSKGRRPVTAGSVPDVPWLQPYPDRQLDEPDAVAVQRETIELAFLAAMQVLPPRQRAAFILRDVLGWPANDTAGLLEISVAAANSALQRARTTLSGHLPQRRAEWTAGEPSAAERRLLEQFIAAHEQCDAKAAIAIAAPDLRVTMPPYPWRYDGLAAIEPLLERAFGPDRDGDWKLLPTWANRMPTAASYLRRYGDTLFRPFKLDVLRVAGEQIVEITTFGPARFADFGLPATLD